MLCNYIFHSICIFKVELYSDQCVIHKSYLTNLKINTSLQTFLHTELCCTLNTCQKLPKCQILRSYEDKKAMFSFSEYVVLVEGCIQHTHWENVFYFIRQKQQVSFPFLYTRLHPVSSEGIWSLEMSFWELSMSMRQPAARLCDSEHSLV